jgi:SAM-dependent methyltransferase
MAPLDVPAPERCPVCTTRRIRLFMTLEGKVYWRCRLCEATFLAPAQWPDLEAQRDEYDKHQNDVGDPRYRAFLSRLSTPLLARMPGGLRGLDFGCGPGPALAHMLEEAGHEMRCYDPLYAPDQSVLDDVYDFITCTEVIEHLHQPRAVFEAFDAMLRPGGWVGIMTEFQTDDSRFAKWHYRRDPTHIIFYRATTLTLLGSRLGWTLEIPRRNIALFRKPR